MMNKAERNKKRRRLLRSRKRCDRCGKSSGQFYYCEACRIKAKIEAKQRRVAVRALALEKYGGAICSCCGEKQTEFLCIDHIEGAGAKHRREIGGGGRLYDWLKRNDFPPGFRVLCYNCNMSRGLYGYCPHEKAFGGEVAE